MNKTERSKALLGGWPGVVQVKKVYLLARGKKQLSAAQRVDKVRAL